MRENWSVGGRQIALEYFNWLPGISRAIKADYRQKPSVSAVGPKLFQISGVGDHSAQANGLAVAQIMLCLDTN